MKLLNGNGREAERTREIERGKVKTPWPPFRIPSITNWER